MVVPLLATSARTGGAAIPGPCCEDDGVSGFLDRFVIASQTDAAPREEEVTRPIWFGPPEDELGVVVPQAIVVGRSQAGVIALRYITAFSTGLLFDLVAAARAAEGVPDECALPRQHVADPDEGLPDGFLRVGRVPGRPPSVEPLWPAPVLGKGTPSREGPVLFQAGGGGGSAGSGRVTMNPAYWLWPLPPAADLRLFVEWPAVEIELSSVELAGEPLVEAASRSQPLWDERS